jgi:hypothetical protein
VSEPRDVDHFTAVPRRFTDAHIADELDATHVLLGLHLAARCYEVVNTAGGVAAVRLAVLAELCEVSNETARRKLHELRELGWIDFDAPEPGQRVAWRIWLTGLAREDESDARSTRAPYQLHTSSTKDPPSVWSSSSTGPRPHVGEIPYGESVSTSTRAPQREAPVSDRRDETRREENSLSKENYDHLVGKTTGEAAAEALERERAFLADCQALVSAGLARWRETGEL